MLNKSSVITLCSSGLAASTAQAAVVTNDFTDITLDSSGVNSIYFDFETLSYSTSNFSGADYNIRASSSGPNQFIVNAFVGSYMTMGGEFVTNGIYGGGESTYGGNRQNLVRAFSLGDTVDATAGGGGYISSTTYAITAANAGGINYEFTGPRAIGLVHRVSSGNFEYGYINVENGSLIIKSAARETTVNQGIVVATVPEPSSLALLSLGVLGIAGYRKRQA